MQGHADDASALVAAGELGALVVDAGLADGVADERVGLLVVVEVVHGHAARRRLHLGAGRRHPDDAHGSRGLVLRRAHEGWRQQLREEVGAHVVDAQLLLVTLHRFGLPLQHHDAGVVEEDVDPVLALQDLVGRGLDLVEVCEVHAHEDQLAFGDWYFPLDVFDGLVPLLLGASGYDDACILGIQDLC